MSRVMAIRKGRFYEVKLYKCPICGTHLWWVKRADRDDSMVLLHTNDGPHSQPPCRLAHRAFYPPAVDMYEIQGALNGDGLFLPEWEASGKLSQSVDKGELILSDIKAADAEKGGAH